MTRLVTLYGALIFLGGKELWKFSFNAPLIYGTLVIDAPQVTRAGVIAPNEATGNLIWKADYLGNESYASPAKVKMDGQDHIVAVVSSTNTIGNRNLTHNCGRIVGIKPKPGKYCGLTMTGYVILLCPILFIQVT
jgi:hypothetical protein